MVAFDQEAEARPKHNWVHWLVLAIVALSIFVIVFFLLVPKPLIVKGTLKTTEGPVASGVYDFRLKFYDITTRTDLIYGHDATGISVDQTVASA